MPAGFCCDFLEVVGGCFTYSALVNGTLMARLRVLATVANDVQPEEKIVSLFCFSSFG
jgi:hypothetical protein